MATTLLPTRAVISTKWEAGPPRSKTSNSPCDSSSTLNNHTYSHSRKGRTASPGISSTTPVELAWMPTATPITSN
jgi:hypothetical protein